MPASHAARVRAVGVLAIAAVLLSACGSSTSPGEPTWTPKPSFSGEGYQPGERQPVQPHPSANPAPASPSPGTSKGDDPAIVATKLRAPTGILILPDNSALVGERTTGRILRVQPVPKQPVQTVRTIAGISTTGGGGLLDLAISPNYGEDNLIFAYITTPTDNRVVEFTLKGPVTTVLAGIPRGSSDNTGRLAFVADGSLLVGTGDAGKPSLALDPNSLAGKILRVTDIGTSARGNPQRGSRVYSSGLRRSDGLCVDPVTRRAFEVEALGGATADPINQITAGGSYGWPKAGAHVQQPLASMPATSRAPGGCAVLNNVLYTTTLDGKALLAADIKTASGGKVSLRPFVVSLRNRYGRLRTVVSAADGALWLTTSNRDGHGRPVADDERVLRIVPTGGGSSNSPL